MTSDEMRAIAIAHRAGYSDEWITENLATAKILAELRGCSIENTMLSVIECLLSFEPRLPTREMSNASASLRRLAEVMLSDEENKPKVFKGRTIEID